MAYFRRWWAVWEIFVPPLDAADLSASDHLLARLSVEHCTSGAVLRLIDEQGVCEVPLPAEALPVIRQAIEIMSKDLAVYLYTYPSATTESYAAELARVSEEFVKDGVAAGQIKLDFPPKADGSPGELQLINMNDVWRLAGVSDSLFLPPAQRKRFSERVRNLLQDRERPAGAMLLAAGRVVPLPSEVLDVARFVVEAMSNTQSISCDSMPLEITEEQAVWVTNSHIAFVKDELEAGRIEFKELNGQCLVDLRSALKREAEVSERSLRSWRAFDELVESLEGPEPPAVDDPQADASVTTAN